MTGTHKWNSEGMKERVCMMSQEDLACTPQERRKYRERTACMRKKTEEWKHRELKRVKVFIGSAFKRYINTWNIVNICTGNIHLRTQLIYIELFFLYVVAECCIFSAFSFLPSNTSYRELNSLFGVTVVGPVIVIGPVLWHSLEENRSPPIH